MSTARIVNTALTLFFVVASSCVCRAQVPLSHPAWQKVIAREIETGQRLEQRAARSAKTNGDNMLAKMMYDAVKAGRVKGWSNLDVTMQTVLTKEYMDDVGLLDSIITIDPVTGKETTKKNQSTPVYKYCHKFRMREEWTYNPASGKTEIQILGIAPVRDVFGDDGEFRGEQAMFWLRYADAVAIINEYEKTHPGSAFTKRIWNDNFSEIIAARTQDGLWKAKAAREIAMPADKEAGIVHHLRDQSGEGGLATSFVDLKYPGILKTFSDPELKNELPRYEFVDSGLAKRDTWVVLDPVTNQEIVKTIMVNLFEKKGLDAKIILAEVWSFNPALGKTEVELTAIAPEVYQAENGRLKLQQMFWARFTDVKDVIDKYGLQHPGNNFETSLWDSYFVADVKSAPLK